jgi:transcriptional regulator with XRE-family HTH domain
MDRMNTPSQLTASCYLMAVKELLKQRGITYCQLADALECSLPTIKRWLNKPSLPLDRLLEIAEVANIDFADIGKRADRLRPQHHVFSDEQDELFVERPEMLAYFQELMGGMTPIEIARQFDLDVRSSSLYLKHLERVGLIKRKPRKQVKLLVRPPVGFGAGSLYLKKEMQNFLTSIVTDVVNGHGSQVDCFAILKPLSLTEHDYRALLDGVKRLVDQYSAISESRIATDKTFQWQIAIACGRGPKSKPSRLPRIGN